MMLLARAATMPWRAMSSTLAAAIRAGYGREAMQFRERRDDRFAERFDEPAGDGRRRLHRHLLAEDRAQAQLESVEGAGHSQTGVRLDGACEARVLARCCAITSGRASRSNSARTRLSSAGSTGVRLWVNSTMQRVLAPATASP